MRIRILIGTTVVRIASVGTFSSKTKGSLQHGTSSTKTDGEFPDGFVCANADGKLQDATFSTKTKGSLQHGTSSTKTDGEFPDGFVCANADGKLQDGTFSTKTKGSLQHGTSSTKTDGEFPDGFVCANADGKLQDGTFSTKTKGSLQHGTSSTKTDGEFPDGFVSANTDGKLQDGTLSTKTGVSLQQGAYSTKTDGEFADGFFSPKTNRKYQDGTYSTKTDGEFLKNKEDECINVHQVRAGSSFVQLKVGNLDINARIDSCAEITILSSTIYHRLKKAPAKVRDVDLQMADNDSVMKGFIIQPLQMKLGNQFLRERVYVASIGDDMLLGHDLLHHLGVCLDMRTDTLVFNEERIPVTTSFKDSRVTVARVSVGKRSKKIILSSQWIS